MLRQFLHDFATLFVVINPIGKVPLFIAIARNETVKQRRHIALQAVLIASAILLAFIAAGQALLDALRIELVSFQIAGGLILLIIALRMVLEEAAIVSGDPPATRGNIAVFPLAMPFIAGPGSILAVVLLTDDNIYTVSEQLETAGVALIVVGLTYLCLIGAHLVQRFLGNTGANVVGRIMGLILAALAVQSMLEGLRQIKLM